MIRNHRTDTNKDYNNDVCPRVNPYLMYCLVQIVTVKVLATTHPEPVSPFLPDSIVHQLRERTDPLRKYQKDNQY